MRKAATPFPDAFIDAFGDIFQNKSATQATKPEHVNSQDAGDSQRDETGGHCPQMLRKAYSTTGAFLGVVPKKVGRRLLWPRDALMRLIEEGVQ